MKTEVDRIIERVELYRDFKEPKKEPKVDFKPGEWKSVPRKKVQKDKVEAILTMYNNGQPTHTKDIMLDILRVSKKGVSTVYADKVIYGQNQSFVFNGPLICDRITIKLKGVPIEKEVYMDKKNHKIEKGSTLTLEAGADGFISLS